jgi:hypothetical protein
MGGFVGNTYSYTTGALLMLRRQKHRSFRGWRITAYSVRLYNSTKPDHDSDFTHYITNACLLKAKGQFVIKSSLNGHILGRR